MLLAWGLVEHFHHFLETLQALLKLQVLLPQLLVLICEAGKFLNKFTYISSALG